MNFGIEKCLVKELENIILKNEDWQSPEYGGEKQNEKFLWIEGTNIKYYFDDSVEELNKTKLKVALEKSIIKWEISKLGITFEEKLDEYDANVTFTQKEQKDNTLLSRAGLRPNEPECCECDFFDEAFCDEQTLNTVVDHQIGHMMGLEHTFDYENDLIPKHLNNMNNSIMNYTSDKVTKEDIERLAALYSREFKILTCPVTSKCQKKNKVFIELG